MSRRMKKPYSIKDVLPVLVQEVEDAVDFTLTEFDDEFETGDRYYNGEVDIPVETGRSGVVSTQVRDSIRNFRPSAMRVLCSNRRRIVKYWPSSVQIAPVVDQQTAYVHQIFWANDGYMVLYSALDECLKHRIGPIKTYWEENPDPKFVRLTNITDQEVMLLEDMPDVEIVSKEKVSPPVGAPEELDFYEIEAVQHATNGRIVMEAIPYGEFFISRNANDCETAAVHGHRRSATVAEAIAMGLEYSDWFALDDADPEQTEIVGTSEANRGYMKEGETERGDELGHKFLLTEAYIKIDLENLGYEQLYVFFLGGTSYEYLDHERIDETSFSICRTDPRPFTPWGDSLSDVTMPQQDVITSVLRGIVDNVHLANTPRFGGNPSQVNFDDLMNHQFGHPIRFKGQGTQVQVVTVPSQIQSTLPMLQWLEQDAQNKVGITKAAQGLDPNAMQSTDKQAVANTIQLAQGQVELAVRNFIETGLISVFRKLLRLSIQHLDRVQTVRIKGVVLPVDQLLFDPDLYAEPQVGLGTVSTEMRIAGLQFTLGQQTQMYTQYGPDNPFVNAHHIYNTLEDLTEEFGLTNVGRYYNMVTPAVEKAYADQKKQEAMAMAQQQKGIDPAMALVQAENIKAGTEKLKTIVKAQSDNQNLQYKALELNAKDDLERDKMVQDRVIELAKIAATTGVKIDDNQIKREQMAKRAEVIPISRDTG